MNRRIAVSSLALMLVLCGCRAQAQRGAPKEPAPKEPWTEGFWVWDVLGASWKEAQPLDAIYFRPRTDNIGRPPPAREYWATFRYEKPGIPPDEFIGQVVTAMKNVQQTTRGVQLDIDSPTGSLRAYAGFLKRVREALPPGQELSITALLDWFRDGTDVAGVIEQVDEFVPQFYDVGDPVRGEGIATRIDAEQWGPRFQRFGKRFRIGISTFGRGRLPYSQKLYRVITPLDIANDPKYKLTTARNAAGELILNYDGPQERIQFVVPTVEGVRAAVENAKQTGAWGVVFFRWPRGQETLVMPPEDALGRGVKRAVEVQARRGDCVVVACYDLALVNAAMTGQETDYRIRSSVEIDYAVAGGNPVQVTGPRELSVRIPPYAAQARIELGRVVTSQSAAFTVEER